MGSRGSRRDYDGLLVPLLKVVNLADLLLAELLVGIKLLDELLVVLEFLAKALILILHGPDVVTLVKSGWDPGRAAQVRGDAEGGQAAGDGGQVDRDDRMQHG